MRQKTLGTSKSLWNTADPALGNLVRHRHAYSTERCTPYVDPFHKDDRAGLRFHEMGEHSKLLAAGKAVVRIEVRKDDGGYVLSRVWSAELVEELETVESPSRAGRARGRSGTRRRLAASRKDHPPQLSPEIPFALQADAIHLSEGMARSNWILARRGFTRARCGRQLVSRGHAWLRAV